MKIGIMQPYLFPYIGYFQLIHAVETFVVLDDVAFIKGGWINRNRLKINGSARFFTVPLAGASPFRPIRETQVAPGPYEHFRRKFFTTLINSYGKSRFFHETLRLAEDVFDARPTTIRDMAYRSIQMICSHLGIPTRVVPSSAIYDDSTLKGAERVMDICKREAADAYINSAGGKELYSKEEFSNAGISLWFLECRPIEYPQTGGGEFIPSLSILDVLMNNSVEEIRRFLTQYDLV